MAPMTNIQLLRHLGTGDEIDQAYQRARNQSNAQAFADRTTQLITGIPTSVNRLAADNIPGYKQSLLYGGIETLWGDEHDARTKAIDQRRSDAELLGQFGGDGTFGELAADMVMFGIPTARIGSMANTTRALTSGVGLGGLTKAAAKDAAFNAAKFAPTDYALSKAYGLDDNEAVINAVSAGAIGALGSPVVSGVMGRKVVKDAMGDLLNKVLKKGKTTEQPQYKAAKPEIQPDKHNRTAYVQQDTPFAKEYPEIDIDGFHFPDEKIKKIPDYVEEAPTVKPKSGLPDKGLAPTDDVIRQAIEEPMEDVARVLADPKHPDFDKTLRREIYRDLGYAKYTDDDILRASDAEAEKMLRANARSKNIARQANQIMQDPKAKEVYRKSLIEKYTPKADEAIEPGLRPEDAVIHDVDGELAVARKGDAAPLDLKPKKTADRTIRATPVEPVDLVTDRLRNIRSSKDRQAADILRQRLKREGTRTGGTSNIKQADSRPEWGERTRRPGSDEATVKVMDQDTTRLGTEREYVGPQVAKRSSEPIGAREKARKKAKQEEAWSREDFDPEVFDNKLRGSQRAKEASTKGYNRVMKGGKPLSRKEINQFVKENVPKDVRNSYKEAMIRASQDLEKQVMEKAAKQRKGFQKPTGRDPMPIDTKKMREAELGATKPKQKIESKKVDAKPKEDTPKQVAKPKSEPKPTGSKPGDVQRKIDADLEARESKLKQEEAKTKSMFDKELDKIKGDAKKFSDFANRVKKAKQPIAFKLKDAKAKGYVPKDIDDVFEYVANKVGDVDVVLQKGVISPNSGNKVGGYYDPKAKKIYVDIDRLKTDQEAHSVVHEAIHAVTLDSLRTNGGFRKEFEGLMKHVMDNLDPKYHNNYAFKNVEEFVAEGFSNPKFIKRLKEMQYGELSAWERFKDWVIKLFGGEINNSVYRNMNRLLEEMTGSPIANKKMTNYLASFRNDFEPTWKKIQDLKNISDDFKEGWEKTITSYETAFKEGKAYEQARELNTATREALNEAARTKEHVKSFIEDVYKQTGHKKGDHFDNGFTESILKTDYRSIQMWKSKGEANRFLNKHKDIYSKARRYIDQTAKGMKDRGAMNNPFYSNNPIHIAQRSGIEPTQENLAIIDKLVSIKAMSDTDWKFVKKYHGTKEFDAMMSLVDKMKVQTDDLFKQQQYMQQKGYISEVYEGIYTYKMVDGKWVKEFDTDPGFVQGILPQKLDASRIGSIKTPEGEPLKNFVEKHRYAEANNLGLILDINSNPRGFRRVASEAERLEMGKSTSALDTIALTMENNVRKLAQEDGVIRQVRQMADEGNELFSPNPKKGFVELTEEELKRVPNQIAGYVRYVNPKFKEMLIGFKEGNIAKSQGAKVAERVLKDMVQHFKENVVLKNPTSWANNAVFGFVMNASEGISAQQTTRYIKEGFRERQQAKKLMEKMFRAELKGNKKTVEKFQKMLEENTYYQMEKEGLAVTVMNNVLDSPNQSVRFTDKAVKLFFKNHGMENAYEKLAMFYLSPQSKTGQAAMQVFGSIDALSRYSMVKGLMENQGIGMKEAVTKANSVYGNMDLITSKWVHDLQQYGFIPFSNWFFRVAGGITETVKNNPVKSLGLGLALYALQEESGYRTESWNPLSVIVDTPLDMIEMSPYNRPVSALKSATMPSIYRKTYNAVKYEDPLSLLITEDWKR